MQTMYVADGQHMVDTPPTHPPSCTVQWRHLLLGIPAIRVGAAIEQHLGDGGVGATAGKVERCAATGVRYIRVRVAVVQKVHYVLYVAKYGAANQRQVAVTRVGYEF